MSRVEPNHTDKREPQKKQERDFLDRTPGKAEGDENTIDEALRNQRDSSDDDRR